MTAIDVAKSLRVFATPERAEANAWFFKTGKGQYGHGDKFLGVSVPDQRKVAKQYKDLPLDQIYKLITSDWHEERLTAVFILVAQYKAGDPNVRKEIAGFYHKNRAFINNWDLVDSSAPYILGDYLTNHSRVVLVRLAKSASVWDRRIAILSTFGWIRQGDFHDAFKIINILINDKHDLIQKAIGWMLREIGKSDKKSLTLFLDEYAATMPRTALRYAIERFPEPQRLYYLNMRIKPARRKSA